ncbi:hypothetical protein ElyMa_002141600 [Elysia marginata]|uniref:Uncharacterized protein n=1 Tax=Elysia marginata TaxID=1093978 RepID=A0AAV4FJK9_9GAST|nr:hypothetical protein ElyMa_002141600 [Elysia marginata]
MVIARRYIYIMCTASIVTSNNSTANKVNTDDWIVTDIAKYSDCKVYGRGSLAAHGSPNPSTGRYALKYPVPRSLRVWQRFNTSYENLQLKAHQQKKPHRILRSVEIMLISKKIYDVE